MGSVEDLRIRSERERESKGKRIIQIGIIWLHFTCFCSAEEFLLFFCFNFQQNFEDWPNNLLSSLKTIADFLVVIL